MISLCTTLTEFMINNVWARLGYFKSILISLYFTEYWSIFLKKYDRHLCSQREDWVRCHNCKRFLRRMKTFSLRNEKHLLRCILHYFNSFFQLLIQDPSASSLSILHKILSVVNFRWKQLYTTWKTKILQIPTIH